MGERNGGKEGGERERGRETRRDSSKTERWEGEPERCREERRHGISGLPAFSAGAAGVSFLSLQFWSHASRSQSGHRYWQTDRISDACRNTLARERTRPPTPKSVNKSKRRGPFARGEPGAASVQHGGPRPLFSVFMSFLLCILFPYLFFVRKNKKALRFPKPGRNLGG